jgi:hypothetical protein
MDSTCPGFLLALMKEDDSVAWEWLAPVVTGVVGVAGIVGSVWTAESGRRGQAQALRRQAEGEDVRSYRAEKRMLFAKVLYEVTTLLDIVQERDLLRPLRAKDPSLAGRFTKNSEAYQAQMATVMRLTLETSVVAGGEMADKVHEVVGILADVAEGRASANTTNGILRGLSEAMRDDLKPGSSASP